MPLQPRILVVALAAMALLGSTAASATTPLITDPAGDANVGAYACQGSTGTPTDPCPTSVSQLSEPGIDVIEGDIAQDGTDLLFRIKVVDIDGAPLYYDRGREFGFQSQYSGITITLGVDNVGQYDTTATGDFQFVNIAAIGTGEPVDVTLNSTTNVLEARVPLAVANDALEAVCATCSPIASGSTFQGFQVKAAYLTDSTKTFGMSCVARCDRGRYSGSYTLS